MNSHGVYIPVGYTVNWHCQKQVFKFLKYLPSMLSVIEILCVCVCIHTHIHMHMFKEWKIPKDRYCIIAFIFV